jgi:DNA polymerase-3 subunit alpha
VLGIDFRNGATPCFLAIAKNNKGFAELNAYLSAFLHNGEEIPPRAPAFKHAFVVYPFDRCGHEADLRLGTNEFLGVHPRDLIRLSRSAWAKQRDKSGYKPHP